MYNRKNIYPRYRCSLYICKSNNLSQQIYKIVVILVISVVIPMVVPVISVIPANRDTESRWHVMSSGNGSHVYEKF